MTSTIQQMMNYPQNSKFWDPLSNFRTGENRHFKLLEILQSIRVQKKREQHCFVHIFYKFKHVVLISGKQHRGCITKLLLQRMFTSTNVATSSCSKVK